MLYDSASRREINLAKGRGEAGKVVEIRVCRMERGKRGTRVVVDGRHDRETFRDGVGVPRGKQERM